MSRNSVVFSLFLCACLGQGLNQKQTVPSDFDFATNAVNRNQHQPTHSCYDAVVLKEDSKVNVITDCNLLEDKLHIHLYKITKKWSCVHRLWISEENQHVSRDVFVDQNTGATDVWIENPLTKSERCSSAVTMILHVDFRDQTTSQQKNFEVNLSSCFNSTKREVRPSENRYTLDFSEDINSKLWETCVEGVYGGGRYNNIKQATSATFAYDSCEDKEVSFTFKFKNGDRHTKTIIFRKKPVIQLFDNTKVIINDSDLLEDELNIAIHNIIDRPECNKETEIRSILGTWGPYYADNVGQDYVKVKNPLELPLKGSVKKPPKTTVIDLLEKNINRYAWKRTLTSPENTNKQNRCLRTSLIVVVKVDQTQRFFKTLNLDPLKCFKTSTRVDKADEESVTIDVNSERGASNSKLFKTCLEDIEIHTQNKTEVKYKREPRNPYLLKILDLNRQENVTLTIKYIFHSGNRTKRLFVPYSQALKQRVERERLETERQTNFIQTVAIPSAVGGVALLLLIVLTAVCIRKRQAKDPKRINYDTDENHTYGTYARGDDGEYEYDVAEVVDDNELYGDVGGAEVHDTNDYYEI